MYPYYYNMMGFGGAGGGLGWFTMLLVWIFLILGIVAFVKYISSKK